MALLGTGHVPGGTEGAQEGEWNTCRPPTLAATLRSCSSLGLSFDHKGLCSCPAPQILSSLALPLSALLSAQRTLLLSILHQREGNSCLDRLSSPSQLLLHCARYTVPGHFSFNPPSCIQNPQKSISCFCHFSHQEFDGRIRAETQDSKTQKRNFIFCLCCAPREARTPPWH